MVTQNFNVNVKIHKDITTVYRCKVTIFFEIIKGLDQKETAFPTAETPLFLKTEID